nr:FAD-dependent oxidoreductase [Rhodococcus sp. (in: high G+C Gram-positive bacteria)]
MAPGWDDDPVVSHWDGLPALEGATSADACVIGLGGSGLAAVEELSARGLRVTGLDAGRVGAGAAGSNGGFLLGGPASFLHSALDVWGLAAVDLYRETLRELDRLEAVLGSAVIRRTGSIRLAGLPGRPEPDDLADARSLLHSLHEHGIAASEYDGELGQGIFLADDAATNPARRVIAHASILRHRSTLFEHSPVTSIRSGLVRTARGSVAAPIVIVAVDGRLEQLIPSLRGRVRTARLQMLATAPGLARRLPCPVYGRWGYDYAQQGPDGRMFVGGGRDLFAEAEWTFDSRPTPAVQSYIDTVAAAMAGRAVAVTSRWAASVGFTDDGRALCTEVDDGVVAIGGYSGTGNLVGPVAARAAVAHLLDGAEIPNYLAR